MFSMTFTNQTLQLHRWR